MPWESHRRRLTPSRQIGRLGVVSLASPLFSVVIPTYNAERFIGLTLHSIFCQTEQDFEIVLVNDGSTDGTLQILENIRDERLRVVTQENGGECAARNRGLREARGRYIAFLDSDDVWHTNHLQQALSFMEQHPEYMWFASAFKQVPDIERADIATPDLGQDTTLATNWYLEAAPKILPSCVTMRREAAQQFPELFQQGFKMFGDSLGWCKFAKKYPMIGLAETPTVLYRFWQGNACTTHNVCRYGTRTEAVKMALAKHVEFNAEPDCPPEARLYFKRFALGNWWSCITSAFLPEEWNEDFAKRRSVVGGGCTGWLRLFTWVSRMALHIMRWGIRQAKESVQRKMDRLAAKTRIRF